MRKVIKWIGITIVGLLALFVLLATTVYFKGSRTLTGPYEASPEPITIPNDEAGLERGRRLAHDIALCSLCHGRDFSGDLVFDEPGLATVYGSNLTKGQGGIGGNFTPEDWVRAIRYGIGKERQGLVVMPSQHFSAMSDQDLAALIAYLQSQPAVDNEVPKRELSILATILVGADQLRISADVVGGNPMPQDVKIGENVAYGQYLTTIATCQDCHAGNFAGNVDPNAGPTGPNLTPGGELARWSYEEFETSMRTGMTPAGHLLDPGQMPWPFYHFSDAELNAIWQFLQSLPELPTN